MDSKTEICPKCFGSKKTMESRESRGFDYKPCTLCKEEGVVSKEVEEDFIFSITEDNFEDNE